MSGFIPIAAGFLAGAAGAMGLGGGFVLILYLSWEGMSAPEARAANLMFFIPTALVSMLINRHSGLIDTSVVPYAAATGSIGAIVGLMISDAADPSFLETVFAIMIIFVGLKELLHRKERATAKKPAVLRG